MVTSGSQNQRTRDELGEEPEVNEKYKVISENVTVRPVTLQMKQNTIGDSWIVGSGTNGLVGTNTATQGGGQQQVGGSARVESVVKVVSGNKDYYDDLETALFNDTGNSTGTWEGGGTAQVGPGQIIQSLDIYKDTDEVKKATMTVDFVTGADSDLEPELSPDGGSNFESVTFGTEHTFTNAGSELRFKLTGATGGATAIPGSIRVRYKN